MMSLLTMLVLCAAPVSGQVLDTDGDPVPGAVVELRDRLVFGPDRNKNVARATTDAAGDCTLEAELGDVTVTATVDGKPIPSSTPSSGGEGKES